MNEKSKLRGPTNKAWWTNKRLVCIAMVLLATIYVIAQPKLEQWTGIDFPDVVDREVTRDKRFQF